MNMSSPTSPVDGEGKPYFTKVELDRLHRRFVKLDKDGNGVIEKSEFLSFPQIAANPLAARIIASLDSTGNDEVNFQDFVHALSIFTLKGNLEQRLRFTFNIYDIDRDGYISNGELYYVLKEMSADNIKDTHLQQVVDKSIVKADLDGDGKISFDEFRQLVEKTECLKQMMLVGF